jgi:predicted DNA-binding ribbon-helix-helix protein
MKSSVVKRSIVLGGHKTSVSLEDAFWKGLKGIAKVRRRALGEVVGEIDAGRECTNLSSAIRLFVLDHYVARGQGQLAQVDNPNSHHERAASRASDRAN